jgi:hypothetical protein
VTVEDRGKFKQHLVRKTNFTMDVSESPEPTSPPKEEEDEEGFQALLRRRCDRDAKLSTPKRRTCHSPNGCGKIFCYLCYPDGDATVSPFTTSKRLRTAKDKDLDSDEPQVEMKKEQNVPVKVKKEPKTKEKPNLRKLEVERNSNAKAEMQWPKGVRICLGSLPLQRIPTRERCHGGNSQASATQQNCARARVASLTRTCQSVNGCGNILCDECFPM